jgi:protein NrfD
MSLSSILFLFLTHLGIGVAFTLLLVSQEAGVKFFRFNAGLAFALMGTGILFRPVEAQQWGLAGSAAMAALTASAAALVIFWASVGRGLRVIRPVLLPAAAAAGALALVAQAIAVSAAAPPTLRALTLASFLTSSALLGGACTAMILGHWYLVIPSMDVSHLQSIVRFHIASLVLRIVLVGAVVFLAIAAWEPGAAPSFERYILSARGIFFWQRVLFGLLGPALLAYLTWETAKIRSTQSATGILYVDFFTVIVGEVLAKYLLLSTSFPL